MRLDLKGQLYFSRHAAAVFAGPRLAVLEFDENSHTLKFTGVEQAPEDMTEDDLFHLTWNGQKNGCGVALKSLLHYIGFRLNGGAQALEIAAMDPQQHSISVLLPAGQMAGDSTVELGP